MATTTRKIDAAALTLAADKIIMAQASSRPVHVHLCPEGEQPHRWSCPSPYCEDVASRPKQCPGHGGELPKDTTAYDFGG